MFCEFTVFKQCQVEAHWTGAQKLLSGVAWQTLFLDILQNESLN